MALVYVYLSTPNINNNYVEYVTEVQAERIFSCDVNIEITLFTFINVYESNKDENDKF